MSASRFNRKARERLLYMATGLVILVIFAVIIWGILYVREVKTPGASPEIAVPVFWLLIAIHLIILAVLVWKIRICRRGGQLRKTGLIIPGIILILISMWMIDTAGGYLEHQPGIYSEAIILFFGAFCGMMAGVIMIMLPTRLPGHQRKIF